MNKEFFSSKIKKLADDQLTALLKIQHPANKEIIQLARAEAESRNLAVDFPDVALTTNSSDGREDWGKLRKWNWAAFLLNGIWALANKLDKWAILCFIPGVNIVAVLYLGFNGNELAFRKSEIKSMKDFMALQQRWNEIAIRLFWAGLALYIIFSVILA
jgi:hypothetical protein